VFCLLGSSHLFRLLTKRTALLSRGIRSKEAVSTVGCAWWSNLSIIFSLKAKMHFETTKKRLIMK
jgi:hypothetical protein